LPADAPEEAELSDPVAVVHGFANARRLSLRALYMDKMLAERPSFRHFQEAIMNGEALSVSIRKFLMKHRT
jgi:hypothetical protein